MTVRVTSNAIIRYLTRVLMIDEAEIREAAGEGASEHHVSVVGCGMLNLTVAEIAAEILPDRLEAAIAFGATRIQRPGFALLCRNGFVTSVEGGMHLFRPARAGINASQGWHPRVQRRRERRARFVLADHMQEG